MDRNQCIPHWQIAVSGANADTSFRFVKNGLVLGGSNEGQARFCGWLEGEGQDQVRLFVFHRYEQDGLHGNSDFGSIAERLACAVLMQPNVGGELTVQEWRLGREAENTQSRRTAKVPCRSGSARPTG